MGRAVKDDRQVGPSLPMAVALQRTGGWGDKIKFEMLVLSGRPPLKSSTNRIGTNGRRRRRAGEGAPLVGGG